MNVTNRDGLTAFHILLVRLMDLSGLENKPMVSRPQSLETDEQLQNSMADIMDCLRVMLEGSLIR